MENAAARRPTVVIDKSFPAAHHAWLLARCAKVYNLADASDAAVLDGSEAARDTVEGLLWYGHAIIDEALLSRFPNLSVVSNFGAGYDHIDTDACTARGLPVGHTPGALSETVADHAMAIMLAAARDVVPGAARANRPDFTHFNPNDLGKQVSGTTIGIVGMGSIGSAIARRAAYGFGQRVLYFNRHRKSIEHEQKTGGAEYCSDLSTLLALSDFVVCCLPATKETNGLMGSDQFRCMKSDAILVNIGRGNCVDHDALAHALSENELARVALDVTEPEPLPRNHPLVLTAGTPLHGRVLITPHQGSATNETRMQMMKMSFDNLLAGTQRGVRLPWLAHESAAAGLYPEGCEVGATTFSGIAANP